MRIGVGSFADHSADTTDMKKLILDVFEADSAHESCLSDQALRRCHTAAVR